MDAYRRASIRRALIALRGARLRVLVAAGLLLVGLGAFAAATDAAKTHAGKVHTVRPSHAAVLRADRPGTAPGKEVVALRTRNSRTYEDAGGQMVARVFPGAVNYRNTHGRWGQIDNRLVSVGGGAYRNAANAFFARLPGDLSKPVRVSAGGDWVEFGLRGAHGTGSVSGASERFGSVFPGVSDSYAVQNDRLSESLTLAGATARNSFVYDVASSSGLRARKAGDGGIDFQNRSGKVVFRFLAPYMFDKGGAASSKVSLSLRRSGGGLVVGLKPDAKWLMSKDRQWPVTIDPDIQFPSNGSTRFHGNTQACTITGGSSANTSSCAGQTVSVGYDGTKASRALFQFDLSSIPNTSYVEAATFGDYSQSRTASVNTNLEVHGLTRSWTTAATWNKYDGTNSWASPGGDFNSAADASSTYYASDGSPAWVIIPGLQKLVQNWVDGTQTNNGLLVKEASPETTNNVISLNTAAYPDGNFWPYMDVWYRSRAGSLPFYTFESQQLNDRMGIKVNVGSGNLELNADDVDFSGRAGFDLGITRSYNAQREFYTDFTNRWMMDPGRGVEIKRFDNGDVAFCGPDGASETFNKSGSTWTAPPGLDATYEEGTFTASNGQTYPQRLTLHDSNEKLYFSGSTLAGADDPVQREEDRNGNGITLTYADRVDGDIGVSSITDSQGRTFSFTRDPITGGITKITDSADSRTWQYSYDAADTWDLKTFTDPNGKVTNYAYDANGNLNQITDPRGNLTQITYDGKRGKVTQIQRFTDVNHTTGPKWTFAYSNTADSKCGDPSTNLTVAGFWGETTVTDPDGNAGQTGHTTTYCYDKQMRVLLTRDGDNHAGTSVYDGDGDITDATTPTLQRYKSSYDGDFRSMFDQQPDVVNNGTNGLKSSLAYDTSITSRADPRFWLPKTGTDTEGNQVAYTYDSLGNVKTATDSLGTTTLTYNGDGTVATATDGNQKTTSYTYTNGNLTQVTPPSPLHSSSATYDASGRVATTIDGNGNAATYAYDNLDRMTSVTYTGGPTISYTYDENGNVLSVSDPTGVTSYAYDRLNEQTQQTLPANKVTTYGYDGAGNLTSLQDVGGSTSYGYDQANLLISAQAPGDTTATTFSYYPDDMPKDTTYPNGVVLHHDYDNPDRLTKITATKGTTTLTSFSYGYTNGTLDSNLVRAVTNKAGAKTTYGYDGRDQLTSAQNANGHDYAYTYDAAGNMRTSAKDSSTTSYGYNDAEERCWSVAGTSGSAACTPTPSGATTFSYDGAGNLLSSSAGFTAHYNKLEQTTDMTSLTGGASEAFGYAGTGQGDRRTAGGSTLGENALGVATDQTSTGTACYRYAPDGSLLSERLPSAGGTCNGSRYYYVYDGQGSVAGLTAADGSMPDTYKYDPYGQTTVTGSIFNPWRYTAGYQDSTGLYKMGARYYSPDLMLWTQQDPLGGGCTYAGDDPVNNTDPSGLYANCGAKSLKKNKYATFKITRGDKRTTTGKIEYTIQYEARGIWKDRTLYTEVKAWSQGRVVGENNTYGRILRGDFRTYFAHTRIFVTPGHLVALWGHVSFEPTPLGGGRTLYGNHFHGYCWATT